MATIEHGERTCELCGRLMGDGWELERHMRDVHERSLTSDDPEGGHEADPTQTA